MAGGQLTQANLIALLEAVADGEYLRPLKEATDEGLDGGIELYEVIAEVFARVSELVDRGTQGLYVQPSSGQTDDPGAGAQSASTTLDVARTVRFHEPIVLVAGQFIAQQLLTDYSPDGGVQVLTGREYVVSETTTLLPGERDAVLPVVCTITGYGGNFAPPATINRPKQAGSGLHNDGASIVPGVAKHRLVCAARPDVVHGQLDGTYVELVAGSNAGRMLRVVGYNPPDPTGTNGGTAVLAASGVASVSGAVGTFTANEEATDGAGARIIVRGVSTTGKMAFEAIEGTLGAGGITGVLSGATATVDAVDTSPALVAETGTCAWRVLSWEDDLGLSVTNADWPEGGKSAMLDEVGEWRDVPRAPGESDASYRKRVRSKADVVTPNAIRRAANRALAAYGIDSILRETGQATFTGAYFDGDPSSTDPAKAFAFDMDFVARPSDARKVLVDYLEMRAFFWIGVPRTALGDFGCFFDAAAPSNAFDAAPAECFFDGYPRTTSILHRTLWHELGRVKAGGVGYDLWME